MKTKVKYRLVWTYQDTQRVVRGSPLFDERKQARVVAKELNEMNLSVRFHTESDEQIDERTCRQIIDFLRAFSHTKEQYWASYSSWSKGGNGWQRRLSFFGGTNTMQALIWYQHVHRPGSKEWRPSIIINALLDQVQIFQETGTSEVPVS